MKHFLMICLVLVGCKAKQEVVTTASPEVSDSNLGCILSKLPKTVNYGEEIERLTNIYQDTIIELERLMIRDTRYKTIFDLRLSSHFVWLIRDSKGNTADSILIQALSPQKSVESFFDLNECTVEKSVNEFFSNGDPKEGYTAITKFGR